jgi:Xaa-Pro aminopeptidase
MYPVAMKLAHVFRPFLACSCLLVSESSALVGLDEGKDEPRALARIGDGRPVCGLGKAFHTGRRAALMERVGDELLLFRGLPGPRDNLPFRQDKTFWYLTGVESPDAALVLDGKSGKQILFLPSQNLPAEIWDGELWDAGDPWVRELTGFEDVRDVDDLIEVVTQLLDGRKRIGTTLSASFGLAGSYDSAIPYDRALEKDPLDGRVSREKALAAKLKERLDVQVFDVNDDLVELRLVKTPEEVEAMRRAARAGALAHVEAMRSTRPGMGEWELEALMSMVQGLEGAFGPAYAAIVGSGANSCVLHYTASDRRLGAGEVVLIDYGPEVDHYTTDITRTWPVSGTFSERAAELYDVVLEAQKAGIAAVKPGASLSDVDAACTAVLTERGFHALKLHGACHWIGMEVHDPGNYRTPLEPGMAFTVEPGLYDRENGIGIRIEDVVVVTKDGCEVLSARAPKERAEVEALIGEEGLLDRFGVRDD